jgi:hypothetical protein
MGEFAPAGTHLWPTLSATADLSDIRIEAPQIASATIGLNRGRPIADRRCGPATAPTPRNWTSLGLPLDSTPLDQAELRRRRTDRRKRNRTGGRSSANLSASTRAPRPPTVGLDHILGEPAQARPDEQPSTRSCWLSPIRANAAQRHRRHRPRADSRASAHGATLGRRRPTGRSSGLRVVVTVGSPCRTFR